jgi:1,4-dihydroxy-6-naphthoate synthase
MEKRKIQLGHSPDPDDAFMFYAISQGYIDTEDLEFEDILQDIQTLNEWAKTGKLEITALSVYGYGMVSDRYALLPYGASVGNKYGPIIVSRNPMNVDQLKTKKIAVPGTLTTAYLTLRLMLGDFEYDVVPFQEIIGKVVEGKYDAGLIIHEGQLTFGDAGLEKVVDLGEWWFSQTQLPLPLGVNTVRKDLGDETMKKVGRILKHSIDYALSHREIAMFHALNYADLMDIGLVDKFVGMYVNDDSLGFNDKTRKGVELLFQKAKEKGYLPASAKIDLVDV